MTALSELISKVGSEYLAAGARERRNLLKTSISDSATTVEFTYDLKNIQEGAVISIDFELMYVVDVNSTANTATVMRSDAGTTAASHSAGAAVLVNPRFAPGLILRALNDELDALSAEGLYQYKQTSITYTGGVDGYDLGDSTAIDVWDVRVDMPGSEKDWPSIPFRWSNGMPTSSFASGVAVWPQWGESGRVFRVFYRAPFNRLTTATGVVETATGLHTQAMDLLCIGAAIRMISGAAVRRARPDTQGDTRRAEEVTTNDALQSVRGLMALREQRLRAEKARLQRLTQPRVRRL